MIITVWKTRFNGVKQAFNGIKRETRKDTFKCIKGRYIYLDSEEESAEDK